MTLVFNPAAVLATNPAAAAAAATDPGAVPTPGPVKKGKKA
jgi:hypothetical protein